MYILKQIEIFSSFGAGNCVSNSSSEWRKIQLKQFGTTRVELFTILLTCVPLASPRQKMIVPSALVPDWYHSIHNDCGNHRGDSIRDGDRNRVNRSKRKEHVMSVLWQWHIVHNNNNTKKTLWKTTCALKSLNHNKTSWETCALKSQNHINSRWYTWNPSYSIVLQLRHLYSNTQSISSLFPILFLR